MSHFREHEDTDPEPPQVVIENVFAIHTGWRGVEQRLSDLCEQARALGYRIDRSTTIDSTPETTP